MRNKQPNTHGHPLLRQRFPAGRGREGRYEIWKKGGTPPKKKSGNRDEFTDIVTLGGNPIQNVTHDEDTNRTSLTFYDKNGRYDHYGVLQEHDDFTLFCYEVWKYLRMRMRERQERKLETSPSTSSQNVGNLYPERVQIPEKFRITKKMMKKIKGIEGKITKFHPPRRKPSGVDYPPPPEVKKPRDPKITNYKNRKTVRKS